VTAPAEPGSAIVDIATDVGRPWWVRPGLEIQDGRLAIAGRDAERLARDRGTPLFVYDRRRFAENAERLIGALDRADLRHRVRFALKANRDPEILEILRSLVGIDACSPGEVIRAIECGWPADEISYTGTNVSDRDLDVLLDAGVHLNLDAISQIDRVGRRIAADGRAPRPIGIRINPAAVPAITRGSPTAATARRSSGSTRTGSTRRRAWPDATACRSTRSTSMRAPVGWRTASRPSRPCWRGSPS
jgi:diaminopimelate decarboxylase